MGLQALLADNVTCAIIRQMLFEPHYLCQTLQAISSTTAGTTVLDAEPQGEAAQEIRALMTKLKGLLK